MICRENITCSQMLMCNLACNGVRQIALGAGPSLPCVVAWPCEPRRYGALVAACVRCGRCPSLLQSGITKIASMTLRSEIGPSSTLQSRGCEAYAKTCEESPTWRCPPTNGWLRRGACQVPGHTSGFTCNMPWVSASLYRSIPMTRPRLLIQCCIQLGWTAAWHPGVGIF